MATAVEIGIFCIGRTQVDREEVRRWLDFMGADEFEIPEDGAVSDPALLIALAGKNCYQSFQKSLNPNLSRIREDYAEYLDNVMKSGHGSVLEHSVYNFAFANISRVFTAEMNRHRAGWAISERSLRFVRFGDNVPYWEPSSIKGPNVLTEADATLCLRIARDMASPVLPAFDTLDAKKQATRIIFNEAFSGQQRLYQLLTRIWADELSPDSKFKGKKEITSLIRRIIGLGVATGGVWSGNIRALRHVLTMRCDPAAEEEILYVFSSVAKMMRDEEPMLFGDFSQTEQGFWVPKYKKI